MGVQGDALHLIYGADGTLLQRKYIQNSVIKDKIDYLRGVEYQMDMAQSIYHIYGRTIRQGVYWEPEYHIKDHLGNVRVTFCDENSNGLIQGSERRSINDYYAYGMEWNNRWELSDTITPVNKYRYNGKELITEMDLDVLHYGARMMDPQLGRMMQSDPRAESFSSVTPYQYGLNNPILNIDPTGMYTQSFIKKADGTREYTIPSAGYNAEMDRYVDNDDIIIRGTRDDKGDAFRIATFNAISSLTDDKIKLNNDGSITIVEKRDGNKKEGTKLIRNLVEGKTASGKDFDVVLTNDNTGRLVNDFPNNAGVFPHNVQNASNSIGTGSDIVISHELNRDLLMQNGLKEKVPYNIAVGHEMIHSDHNRMGIRNTSRLEPYDRKIRNNEELRTIKRENILRSEYNLNIRYHGNF